MNKNELRAEIARAGLTMTAVAKLMNIQPTTLSHKINGKVEFSRSEIQSLANVLKLDDSAIMRIFFTDQLT